MEEESVGKNEASDLLFQSDFLFGDASYNSNLPESESDDDGEEYSDLPDSILAHLYFTSSLNNTTESSVIPQELEERYQRSLEMDSSPSPGPWYGNRASSSCEPSLPDSSGCGVEERADAVDHIIILSSDSDTPATCTRRLKSWPSSPLAKAVPAPTKRTAPEKRQRSASANLLHEREGAEDKRAEGGKKSKKNKRKKAASKRKGAVSKKADVAIVESSGEGSEPMILDSDCEILSENSGNNSEAKGRNLWEISEKDRLGRDEYEKRHGKGFQRYSMKAFRCSNCRQRGHLEETCPQPKRHQRCYLCAGLNHVSSQCSQSLCQYCFQRSHRGRPCLPQLSNPRAYCSRCYMSGHGESVCPDVWRQFHNTTHLHDRLVKIPPERQRRTGPVYCYKCGREGHYGFECQFPNPRGYPHPMLPLVARYDKGVVVVNRKRSIAAFAGGSSGGSCSSTQRKVDRHNQSSGRSSKSNNVQGKKSRKESDRHHQPHQDSRLLPRRESGEISDSDDEDDVDEGRRHWSVPDREVRKRSHHHLDSPNRAIPKRQKFYEPHPLPAESFLPLPDPPRPPLLPETGLPPIRFLPGRSRTDPGRPLNSTPLRYPPPPPPLPPLSSRYPPLHHGDPTLTITLPSYSHRRSLSSDICRLPEDNFEPDPHTLSRRRYVQDYSDDQVSFPRTPFPPEGNFREKCYYTQNYLPSLSRDQTKYNSGQGRSDDRRHSIETDRRVNQGEHRSDDRRHSREADRRVDHGERYDKYNNSHSHSSRVRDVPQKFTRRLSAPSPAQDLQQRQRRNSRGFVGSQSSYRRVSTEYN